MELKVWVEGIQRIVCGVNESTTCQDVVYALANATRKSGRFTLIERWRNNERVLSPTENPLKVLTKWGEYSNDVQFILQKCDPKPSSQSPASVKSNSKSPTASNLSSPTSSSIIVESPERGRGDARRNPSAFNGPRNDNVGIVRGIPQIRPLEVIDNNSSSSSPKRGHNSGSSQCGSDKSASPSFQYQKMRREAPPYKDPPAPPPYRDPPPPDARKKLLFSPEKVNKNEELVMYNAQYRELVNLVNCQREKLSNQQADLTKYDAEIVFWEGKGREQQCQLEYITQEILNVGNKCRVNSEQLQALSYIEEESEIVKQQEKILKSELTLLRSKLANCETELLQCKNKMRLIIDELQTEQRLQMRRSESHRQLERNLIVEMERLQRDVELAKQSTEMHHKTADTLRKEVAALEIAISEKKKQVEHLVTEMKEANLQSLLIAPPEDIKHVIEGPHKVGSTRRMIGSPRQLENAVPTNKNPHGVWV